MDFELHEDTLCVDAVCTVKLRGQTGVEMEALTGVSVALLTIYDMCKALSQDHGNRRHSSGAEIRRQKWKLYSGGGERMNYRVAVLTLSDKGARGVRKDRSGPAVAELVCAAGFEVVYQKLLSDDLEAMQAELARLCDEHVCDLLLTTGGTGFSSRDVTPEATLAVAERQANGIAEAMRWHSLTITPRAMLSRGVSVLRKQTLIVNLPGSEKAVREHLSYLLPVLPHALGILTGRENECGGDGGAVCPCDRGGGVNGVLSDFAVSGRGKGTDPAAHGAAGA